MMPKWTLFDAAEELARRKLKLNAEYKAHGAELVPHPPHKWRRAIMKMGIPLPSGPWPDGSWTDDRHRAAINREDIENLQAQEEDTS